MVIKVGTICGDVKSGEHNTTNTSARAKLRLRNGPSACSLLSLRRAQPNRTLARWFAGKPRPEKAPSRFVIRAAGASDRQAKCLEPPWLRRSFRVGSSRRTESQFPAGTTTPCDASCRFSATRESICGWATDAVPRRRSSRSGVGILSG